MTIAELSLKTIEKFPVIRTNDFQQDLHQALSDYLNDIRGTDMSAILGEVAKNRIEQKIEELMTNLNDIISLYYEGRHSDALQLFQKQMNGKDGLFDNIRILTIKENETKHKDEFSETKKEEIPTILYRARKFEDKRNHTFKDMFHIPLNQREIVKTQRYSAPGYPCLYLGGTIYSCWEEMHRPRFDDLMFSGFKVRNDFKVFDMRVPNKRDFDEDSLEKTLLRLPLIIACQVKVQNSNDPFKPEYIIPQFLIETIICNNREQWKENAGPFGLVWGIIYTSTHISKDFPFGFDFLENIALPVVQSDHESHYCNFLASLFDISDPMCSEYEELKQNSSRLFIDDMGSRSPEELLKEQYEQSKMGYLQGKIDEYGIFSTLDHFVIDTPKSGIKIPQDGSPATFTVRSNKPWSFEEITTSDDN